MEMIGQLNDLAANPRTEHPLHTG